MAKPKTKTKAHEGFDSELAFHQREWRIERVGWAGIAIALLLALAGMFGGGPLSAVRVTDPASGTIEYERWLRNGTDTRLTITPAAGDESRDSVRVVLPDHYLEAFKVERVTPDPARTRLERGGVVYEFEHTGSGASITFHVRPERIGSHSAELVVGAGRPVVLRQFTYP